ncbi:calmodulin-regulated spectrin-associated protein patronin isoform X3 [Dermatophagoides farinae]|uniref:calmodulin-regulated spectrin-associated protein patronin isoform X3 n=1 Tax=Dermatophagoides farinae TaxID=6954 RepID=UPI003F63FC0E
MMVRIFHHKNQRQNNNGRLINIKNGQTQQKCLTLKMIKQAKHRASILWLIAKATDNGRIPTELRDPFYRDHQGQELLKPWITQRMANAELYGRALANIYGVPDYSSFSHQNILQLLTRRGVFTDQLGIAEIGEHITETMLLKNCPVKLAAHMVIIECIMMLYIREILIPIKVMEVTSRFSGEDIDGVVYTELPPSTEPEDVALYWVNRACSQLNQEIARDYIQQQQQQQSDDGDCQPPPPPPVVVPSLEELSDMCDGCSLFALMAFYCPDHVDWREICLKQDISIADSIYNLQRIQYFCQELFPSDICFLLLEDFLYLPEPIVPNFLAFIADLLFMFEIQPVESVIPPYIRLYPELYQEEYHPSYPQMLTPSEMKAKSLKSTWNNNNNNNNNDSIETSSGGGASVEYPPNHPIYDRPSYTQQPQRTLSNLTLSYHQQQHQHGTSSSSSRRNSLNKSMNRRSSFLSTNGMNEMISNHNHHHLHDQSPDVEDESLYIEPMTNPNNSDDPNVTQLSQYFSSINLTPSLSNNHHGTMMMKDNNDEYHKNRSRASGGHLNDYFSSLSTVDQQQQQHSTNAINNNTHVRAQRQHPNNADNVKQLLHHHHHHHKDHHGSYNNNNNANDSQTNSSDTSSIAEMSDYSTITGTGAATADQSLIRAQLNEKRKQIEQDRQQERQKRVSSDHNFRQEVLKTLKNQHQQQDMIMDTMDFCRTDNLDDDNLTFEIHELNPIRREKTFTSIPSSVLASSTTTTTNNNKSTFVRKNLFSASDDLKASMTDLNYANAKDYHPPHHHSSFSSKSDSNSTKSIVNDQSSKIVETSEQKQSSESTTPPSEHNKLDQEIQSQESSSSAIIQPLSTQQSQTQTTPSIPLPQPPSSSQQQQQQQQQQTPRRSQWGQPMIPLAGQHQIHGGVLPPAPPIVPSTHPYHQPPAWSQTAPPIGYDSQWYHHHHHHQSPYHHPPPQSAYPPYGYVPPPPPPPMHPYDPYGGGAYVSPPGTTATATSQDPYVLSPMSGYPPQPPTHTITPQQFSTIPVTDQQQQQHQSINNNNLNDNSTSTNDHHHEQQQQPQQHPNNKTQPSSSQQTETFFISFNDCGNQQQKQQQQQTKRTRSIKTESNDKPTLTRTATQTLVSGTESGKKSQNVVDEQMDERIRELYNVRRPSIPSVPAVSFVIAADDLQNDNFNNSDTNHQLEDSLMMMNGSLMINGDGGDDHYYGDDSATPQRSHSSSMNNNQSLSGKSEEEMQRKKEAIMKQSLRRRAQHEQKRIQKEQELAAKRERERLKREQMERKKEEEREKRAFIFDQYKRRKQLAEEIEKNGGVAALQGTVARSSSTLILNRGGGGTSSLHQQQQVKMRQGTGTQQRPRPKSLHATLLDECSAALSTISGSVSGSSSRLSTSRDEIDDLMSCGRLSSAASISGVGTSNISRPQSAMSSQLCLNSSSNTAVSTPTGAFGEHHHSSAFAGLSSAFGTDLSSGIGIGCSNNNNQQQQQLQNQGPTSSNFFQEYNGPKLFVKPSQKSNKALILNAINVVLAGAVNSDTNRRVTEVINKCDSKYYLILFRNSGLQYRAIYSYNPEREEVTKLDGIGPKIVHNDMIDKFYKYNSGTKSFTAIQTKHLCVTIDAFTIHNHLWMSKAKQQQLQSTPRRFM